MMKFE